MLDHQLIEQIMDSVYAEVELAIAEGNPPFGAVITDRAGTIVAQAHNTQYSTTDPTAHAEIRLLRQAGQHLQTRYLPDCLIFINAEPCSMCLSAIVKTNIETVYYGAPQEDHNNPDIRAADIKARTSTPLELHAGIMKERFKEQIRRGRQALEQVGKAVAPRGFKEE